MLLDFSHYESSFGTFEPSDRRGVGYLPGWLECPATWPVPTAYAVAHGAGPNAILGREPAALQAITDAIERLSDVAEVITTDCGYFWAVRSSPGGVPTGARVLFSLDLLPLAATVTDLAIGVLTYSEEHAEHLLADHPLRDRLVLVGFSHLPAWKAIGRDDFVQAGGWTNDSLKSEMVDVLSHEMTAGRLVGAGVLVIEVAVLPQFRDVIRKISGLPVLDAPNAAVGMMQSSVIASQ